MSTTQEKKQTSQEERRAIQREYTTAKHDQWVFDETRQRQLKAQTAAEPPRKPK
ncbi:MAG: hypothetical protein FWC43_13655 [Planctomycetaceae bacterium]|nr:hypothetical protein [Planctomycetaceae bacterium]